jgi:hypothetical protein
MRGGSLPVNPSEVEYEMTKSGSGFMDTVKSFMPSFGSRGNVSSDSGSSFGKILGRLLNTKTASVMAQEALPSLGDYVTRRSDPSIQAREDYAMRRSMEEDELRDMKRNIDKMRTMREYEKTYDSSSQQKDEEFERLRKEVAEAKLKAEIEKMQKDPNALRISHGGRSIALADMTDAQLDALNTAHQLSKEIVGEGIISATATELLKPVKASLNELADKFKDLSEDEKDNLRRDLFGKVNGEVLVQKIKGGGFLGDIIGSIF